MAKIKLDPLFSEISGTLDDYVFKKSKKGEMIVARRPRKSTVEPSAAQLAQRERLKLANQYASDALADPDLRAFYEQIASKEGRSAYEAARSDYYDGNDLLSDPHRR
jgi:hypothetical protein